jgi:DNA-binding CsgD family transcriptional regulator
MRQEPSSDVASAGRRAASCGPPTSGPESPFGLVGRADELATITELLEYRTGGQLLTGEPGAGKTRLLNEAKTRAGERGWFVTQVFAGAAPDPDGGLGALPEGHPVLLCVDDAHLLNQAWASAIFAAVASGRALLFATLRAGQPVHEPLISLWKDGHCAQQEVQPLDRAKADELARGILGGIVDGTTLARCWRLTEGNPLYLREMLAGGIQTRALIRDRDVWQWHGPMTPSTNVIQLVEAHIGVHSAADREALELVAVGEPLSPETLERAGAEPAALERLERAGVIDVVEVGRRTLVRGKHPMIGSAIRTSAGPLRTRGLQRRLAAAWRTFGGRDDDQLRLAAALIGSGDHPSSPDLLLAAARRAGTRQEFALMEHIARAAVDAGGGVLAAAQLGEALSRLERRDEAAEILDRYGSCASTDAERVAIAELADLHQRRRALEAVAEAPVPPSPQAGIPRPLDPSGSDQSDGIPEPEQVLRLFSMIGRGQVAKAITIGEREYVLDAETRGAERDQTLPSAAPLHYEELACALCMAQLAGGHISEAHSLADAGYRRNTDRHWRLYAALWACCLGEVAYAQGRLTESLHRMQEAVATVATLSRSHPYALMLEHLALVGVARAAAVLGDLSTAEVALEASAGLPDEPSDITTYWPGEHGSWLEVARGRVAQASDLALAYAKCYSRKQLTGFEVAALHLAARLGAATEAAAALSAAVQRNGDAPLTDSELGSLACAHINALAAGDAAALNALSQSYAGRGAMLLAAEAAAAASLHYGRSEGRDRAAALNCATRAHQWAALCEGASTPALTALREPQSLTGRQREIAHLAITGMHSKEIATRLVVSIRTVDNALGVIYRKLGVRSRQELAVLLAPFDLEESSPAGASPVATPSR